MLPCPTCGANIDAQNDELAIAACGQCGGLFEWPALPAPANAMHRSRRVKVESRSGKVRAIRWRNVTVTVIAGLLLVSLMAVGVLSSWHGPIGATVTGVLGIWVLLSAVIPRVMGIHIELGPVISIRNGLARRRRFAAASIRQPFVRRRDLGFADARYDLCATQTDGTVVTLGEGFPSAFDALSVEHELETALGIVDAPVPGEYGRRAADRSEATAPLRAISLICPACSRPVTASDLQLTKGQATCAGCRKEMILGGPATAGLRSVVLLPPPRAVVVRSAGAFALEATLGTGEPVAVGHVLLTLFGAVLFFQQFLFQATNAVLPIMACFLALLWGWAAWFAVVRFRNHVGIRVEDSVLHVNVGPIPPRVRRSIPVAEIAQVFVRQQPRTFFTFTLKSDGYELCAVDRRGAVLPLVGWMLDLREARYLEEQLERHLGIADAPVSGEVEGKMLRHEAGAPSLPGGGNLSLPDASTGGELSVTRAAGALSEPD